MDFLGCYFRIFIDRSTKLDWVKSLARLTHIFGWALWFTARILWIVQGDIISPALLILDLIPLTVFTMYLLYSIVIAKHFCGIIVSPAIITYYACPVLSNYYIYMGNAEIAYSYTKFSLFVVSAMVAIIGGRVTPNFTRGYLKALIQALMSKIEYTDYQLLSLLCLVQGGRYHLTKT